MRCTLRTLAVVFVMVTTTSHSGAESIYLCAHKTNGKLRLVSAPGQCHSTEQELSIDSVEGVTQVLSQLAGKVEALEAALGVFNEAPTVNCGDDQMTLLSQPIQLNASVIDDGILQPPALEWKTVDGPAEAIFSNAHTSSTQVLFPAVGSYILALRAFDGYVEVEDQLAVTVYPDNDPPLVGPFDNVAVRYTRTLEWGDEYVYHCDAPIEGTASDDGIPLPLSLNWSYWLPYDYEWQTDAYYIAYGPEFTVFDSPSTRLVTTIRLLYPTDPTPPPDLLIEAILSAADGAFVVESSVNVTCYWD